MPAGVLDSSSNGEHADRRQENKGKSRWWKPPPARSRTMTVDPKTHKLYLPRAYVPRLLRRLTTEAARTGAPDTFMLLL